MYIMPDTSDYNSSAHQIVLDILRQTLRGGIPGSISKLTGGVVNQVYRVTTTEEQLVVRFNADSLAVFQKERWAMQKASEVGARVPEVFAVGEVENQSFMLMEYVPGVMLSDYRGDREAAFSELGRQTRLINDTPVTGFGFHLDWSVKDDPVFTETWADLCDSEHRMIFGNNALITMGALTADQDSRVRDYLAPLESWNIHPSLCHGDLNSNNVLVQADGNIVILDWTQVKGGASPFYDLSRLSFQDADDFRAMCFGYGLSERQISNQRDDMHRVALKDVLRAASWAFSVQHPELEKFSRDVQELYNRIFPHQHRLSNKAGPD